MRAIVLSVALIALMMLVSVAQAGNLKLKKQEKAIGGAIIKDAPKTVTSLNVTAYLGLWYQMYADLFDSDTFQPKSFCATATYGLDSNRPGDVTVFNWEHYGSVTGPVHNITGYAYRKNATGEPGQLLVVLYGGAPFPAPYWIVALGPMEKGQYEWAVVTDPLRLTLFVLARDVKRFEASYKKTVLAKVKELGFTSFVDEPHKVVQDGCTYHH